MAIFDSKIAAGKCQANEPGRWMLSKECYVSVDEAITEQRGHQSAHTKKAAEGKFRRHSSFATRQKNASIERGGDCAHEKGEDRRPEAEEGGDHSQQFDVA